MTSDPAAGGKRRSPDDLLFTDRDGAPAQLQDVIDDGLDGVYDDRIDELAELMANGRPYHRLLACVALTSWGDPRGFEQLIEWATAPERTPWADHPVTFDRISGADSSFESLADALRSSFRSRAGVSLRPLQERAARALLGVAPRWYVGRMLSLAIVRDAEVEAALAPEVANAVRAAIAELRDGSRPGFDLAFQAASLLLASVRVEDDETARLAEELIAIAGSNERMLVELAGALARGNGPATMKMLERLAASENARVAAEAQEARARRLGTT